jgi:hypothetical protein
VDRRLEFVESAMNQLQDTLEHPLGRRACPPDVLSGISRLWAERDRFVGILERLPRTLCHHDTQRRNLFARRDAEGRDQTVAIDWSWLGTGVAGEEIAALLWASMDFFALDPANARELDTIVFDSYLKGLQDASWHGDPRVVRLGYAIVSSLIFGAGSAAVSLLAYRDDEGKRERVKQLFGRTIEEVLDHRAEVRRFILRLADEARELLDEM